MSSKRPIFTTSSEILGSAAPAAVQHRLAMKARAYRERFMASAPLIVVVNSGSTFERTSLQGNFIILSPRERAALPALRRQTAKMYAAVHQQKFTRHFVRFQEIDHGARDILGDDRLAERRAILEA